MLCQMPMVICREDPLNSKNQAFRALGPPPG